ncbi:Hypoxanthine phosphoribosyltransferase [Gammaproteobacteria bacterium]
MSIAEQIHDLQDTHIEIRTMITELKQVMNQEQLAVRPTARMAHHMLCDLTAIIHDHLAEEDKHLYPPLLSHEDPKIRNLVWGFLNGEKAVRKQCDDYRHKWLKECRFEFSDEFITTTLEMLDHVMMRIEQEETLLYPKLQTTGK